MQSVATSAAEEAVANIRIILAQKLVIVIFNVLWQGVKRRHGKRAITNIVFMHFGVHLAAEKVWFKTQQPLVPRHLF